MTARTSLFGGAALGALFAVALAPLAHAATHHQPHRAHAPAVDSGLRAEVDALKAQVEALQARADQEAASGQQTRAQVQQLQGQLAEANVRAERAEAQAQSRIETIPGEINTAVAANKPKPGWSDSTRVSGRMYYDLTNIDEKSNIGNPGLSFPAPTSKSANGTNFDIKRFYVSVDHDFNSVFSADITTDFNYDSGPAGATQLYIKKAYLQAKLSPWVAVRLGAADMPWVPFDEDVYGYRYVESTLVDRTKFGTSSDWGAHMLGGGPLGPLTAGYQLSVVNGMGYKKPGFLGGVNRSEGMDFEGRVNVGYKGFVAAIGGYSGKLGQEFSGGSPTYHTAERFDALAAYSNKVFRVGGEYMWANADVSASQITLAPPAKADRSDAWEIFGNVDLTPKIAIFGRYDWVRPKQTTLSALENTYYNIGISYEPVKIVDFALAYKHDEIDHGMFADQNFATAAGNGKGTYDEVGLWGQFRW